MLKKELSIALEDAGYKPWDKTLDDLMSVLDLMTGQCSYFDMKEVNRICSPLSRGKGRVRPLSTLVDAGVLERVKRTSNGIEYRSVALAENSTIDTLYCKECRSHNVMQLKDSEYGCSHYSPAIKRVFPVEVYNEEF